MGDKKALSRIFANCLEEQSANGTHQGWCEFTKRGFNLGRQGKVLRGQYQLFREHAIAISAENQMPQLWILKAQQSYNQMGIAEVTCEGGCSCAAQRVDAHQTSPTRNVSVVRTSSFEVSAAAACVLRFVVLEESSSGGGHKWKLTQVAVTPRQNRTTLYREA